MDRGAWWATVHGVAKSGTRLNDLEQQGLLDVESSATLGLIVSNQFLLYL